MARLKETYLNEIVDAMMKKFEYKNVMQDRKSTRLNSSHNRESRMPSSA